LGVLPASSILDVTLVRGSVSHSVIGAAGQVIVGDVLLVRTKH
jgi:hypothetical protein